MRELSLFTGIGGGLLGTHLLGFEVVGYVEFNEYCQRIIRQRIDDGIFADAPIFGDIRAFVSEGYAAAYQGLVDIVTGGFPCQPFSVAGKQAAVDDPRNMWPTTIDVIRTVRPRYAFLENVPGLLAGTHGYFGHILRELAEAGYDAEWLCLSCADVGGLHQRNRIWLYAIRDTERLRLQDGTRKHIWPELTARARWSTESNIQRISDGLPNWMDRLKAIGNAQVPIVAAVAFCELWRRMMDAQPPAERP